MYTSTPEMNYWIESTSKNMTDEIDKQREKRSDGDFIEVWIREETTRAEQSLKESKRSQKSEWVEPPKPRSRIAKCPAPTSIISFDAWKRTIQANFVDLLPAAEATATMLAQFLITDITNPFALVLVDVPSSGKTIAINFFDGVAGLSYSSDKFTPASFVSNAANIKKEGLAAIDLLPRIQYRLLLVRDFATLFSKREEDLKELIGILTRVLDGEGLNTDSGVHGQRQYNGEYLFMLLAASTPIPPRVYKIMGNLGSRLFFLSINSHEKTEEELWTQVTDTGYKEKERECQSTTKNFLYGLWAKYPDGIAWNKGADDKSVMAIIARSAKLLANLRGVINVYTDDFTNTDKYEAPLIERPDRINQLLYNFVRGHALVCGRSQIARDDLPLILALVLDSAPTTRAHLFKCMLKHGGSMTTSEVENELNCSKPTARTEMKKLQILKICTASEEANGECTVTLSSDFSWFLSDEFRQLQATEPIK